MESYHIKLLFKSNKNVELKYKLIITLNNTGKSYISPSSSNKDSRSVVGKLRAPVIGRK